jgi:glyceraldehyde-3-phosphate dehydrogenase/erythrose-4-phosphate dehydrogenase
LSSAGGNDGTCKLVRVLAWHHNEWGFSKRTVEAAAHFGRMS